MAKAKVVARTAQAWRTTRAGDESILNSLSAHIAVLGGDGTILATNRAWDRFARANGNAPARSAGPGANYLHECRRAAAEGGLCAVAALKGIQSVLQGKRRAFELEYPCHSGNKQRWFLMQVSPLKGRKRGAVISHTDVTDRKTAELAVQRSESTIRALLESTTQSILAVDSNEKIVLANGASEKMFGYSRAELLGQSLEILIPPGVRKRHKANHVAYFANAESRPMGSGLQLEACRKGGTTFPVEIGLSGVKTDREKLAVAFVSDITQRRSMESILRQSEERLKLAVDSAGLGLFDFDPRTRKRIWSNTLRRQFGLPPDVEVDDNAVLPALHPDDRGVEARMVEEARRTPGGGYAVEFRTIGKRDRTERWISATGRVFFDDEGGPLRIIGATRDLTGRKRIEETLRQREQEIREVIDGTPDVIMRLDRRLRFTFVNAKTAAVAGIPREAFIGKTSVELGLPKHLVDLWTPVTTRTFATGKPDTLSFSYPSPDKVTDWEELFIPEFAPDGSVASVLIIGRDVTERNRLGRIAERSRNQIHALAASLLTAQEEERRRVSRELHDQICQELASLAMDIGGLAAIPPPEDRERRLKELQARVIKTSEMTRHIAYQMHPSILDDLGLVASLRSLCREFSERAADIELKFSCDAAHVPMSREVASCLYRIAQQSLENIAQHAGAGHVSVTLKFRKGAASLTISDDGVGFDPVEVQGQGGLGLVGMAERARLVQADLSISSSPGRGTRIVVEVPLSGRIT